MRKLLLGALLLLSMVSFAQTKIIYSKDVMTDKESVSISDVLMCSEDGKKGFIVMVSLNLKDGIVNYNGLIVKSAYVGGCHENDTLILLFDDDTKVTLSMWNKFNCDGSSYFDFYKKEFESFSTKKVKAIRLSNGRTYDSYTYVLKPSEQTYFIDVAALIKANVYSTK